MAPVKKRKKLSSTDHHPISATDTNHQKPLGSFVTFGKRRSLRVAMKTKSRRWLCNDIWMDILPLFRRPQLGRKLALLSPRFNALVDKHFDGKNELTISRQIRIARNGTKLLSVVTKSNPLPNKIRFDNLRIEYIDHSVIEFLRSNKQIFAKGTNMDLYLDLDFDDVYDNNGIAQSIWSVFAREFWPIFAPNIRHLRVPVGNQLDDLLHHISPTIFTDCTQLDSIDSGDLLLDAIGDDGPNATAGQALSKWLHIPTTNGQPKQFRDDYTSESNEWVNNFKKEFLRANTSSASYIIQFKTYTTSVAQFELVNERTNEKLTLNAEDDVVYTHINCVLKRCQIGETIQWEDKKTDNLNNVNISLHGNCIGPLFPPKTGQINAKNLLQMNPGTNGQRKK